MTILLVVSSPSNNLHQMYAFYCSGPNTAVHLKPDRREMQSTNTKCQEEQMFGRKVRYVEGKAPWGRNLQRNSEEPMEVSKRGNRKGELNNRTSA